MAGWYCDVLGDVIYFRQAILLAGNLDRKPIGWIMRQYGLVTSPSVVETSKLSLFTTSKNEHIKLYCFLLANNIGMHIIWKQCCQLVAFVCQIWQLSNSLLQQFFCKKQIFLWLLGTNVLFWEHHKHTFCWSAVTVVRKNWILCEPYPILWWWKVIITVSREAKWEENLTSHGNGSTWVTHAESGHLFTTGCYCNEWFIVTIK